MPAKTRASFTSRTAREKLGNARQNSRNPFGIDPEGCVVAESAGINRNFQTRVLVR
jgi:hypothetical protein